MLSSLFELALYRGDVELVEQLLQQHELPSSLTRHYLHLCLDQLMQHPQQIIQLHHTPKSVCEYLDLILGFQAPKHHQYKHDEIKLELQRQCVLLALSSPLWSNDDIPTLITTLLPPSHTPSPQSTLSSELMSLLSQRTTTTTSSSTTTGAATPSTSTTKPIMSARLHHYMTSQHPWEKCATLVRGYLAHIKETTWKIPTLIQMEDSCTAEELFGACGLSESEFESIHNLTHPDVAAFVARYSDGYYNSNYNMTQTT